MKLIEEMNFRGKKYVFKNREEAGLFLARRLKRYTNKNIMILAIPSGGIPIGRIIAEELKANFELIIARKIQFPDNPEAGFGAVSFDGEKVLNQALIKRACLTEEIVKEQIRVTKEEIKRRMKVFGTKRLPELKGKIVIITDDGLASGYTMLAAIKSVKKHKPRKLIVAVPTGNSEAIRLIGKEVDEIYCLNIRNELIFAVADAYKEWYDLSDEEVIEWLKRRKLSF